MDHENHTQVPEMDGIPSQNRNRIDAQGKIARDREARSVTESHHKGIRSARGNLLTAEKYAIHLDGEGDAQWADLYNNSRVVIPSAWPGQVRPTENLLRPIVDNAVAYHTTKPFRFAVEATADRESRQRSTIDAAIINHMNRRGRWNRVFAEAMYIAEVAGHCPVHGFWRDDMTTDPYEPVGMPAGTGGDSIRKGFFDPYVGDPWDTAYNAGARRNSLHEYTYGRTLPTSIVKAAFAHVPGIETLEGNRSEPSASRFQRTSRRWQMEGIGMHGQASLSTGAQTEPLIAVIARERAPGTDPEYPQGRITLVALPFAAVSDKEGRTSASFMLHDGPLPARRFSSVRVYSHQRHDDIRGKPFVSDLDDLQVQLNQLLMYRIEYIRRNTRAPLWHTGMIVEDTAVFEDNAEMEGDPGSQPPQYLQLKIDGNTLDTAINETRNAMWTIGGYQAASRGESNAGDSGAKVVALARADDSIHGPVNQRFKEDVEDFAKLGHANFREFADIPLLIEASGSEFTYMTDAYVDRSMVSQEDPSVELVSGFGATLETLANQLTQMVTTSGADGEPLLTTRHFRAAWPDRSIYPGEEDVQETRERKAKSVNARIRSLSKEMEDQMGEMAMSPQNILMMHFALEKEFPKASDDDPMANYDALSSITQDLNESKLARELAKYRQAFYQGWLIQNQMMPPPPMPLADINELMAQAEAQPQPQQAPPAQGQPERAQPQPQSQGQPQQGSGPTNPGIGGTQSSEAISPAPGEIAQLTAEAQGA